MMRRLAGLSVAASAGDDRVILLRGGCEMQQASHYLRERFIVEEEVAYGFGAWAMYQGLTDYAVLKDAYHSETVAWYLRSTMVRSKDDGQRHLLRFGRHLHLCIRKRTLCRSVSAQTKRSNHADGAIRKNRRRPDDAELRSCQRSKVFRYLTEGSVDAEMCESFELIPGFDSEKLHFERA